MRWVHYCHSITVHRLTINWPLDQPSGSGAWPFWAPHCPPGMPWCNQKYVNFRGMDCFETGGRGQQGDGWVLLGSWGWGWIISELNCLVVSWNYDYLMITDRSLWQLYKYNQQPYILIMCGRLVFVTCEYACMYYTLTLLLLHATLGTDC